MSWIAGLKCGDERCGCTGRPRTFQVSIGGVDMGPGWVLGPAGQEALERQSTRVITGRAVSVGPVDDALPGLQAQWDARGSIRLPAGRYVEWYRPEVVSGDAVVDETGAVGPTPGQPWPEETP